VQNVHPDENGDMWAKVLIEDAPAKTAKTKRGAKRKR
jgi:hypothetical protein